MHYCSTLPVLGEDADSLDGGCRHRMVTCIARFQLIKGEAVSVAGLGQKSGRRTGLVGRVTAAIRRNHALEHATVHMLTSRMPSLRVVGRTTVGGFYLYGDVETDAVRDAVREAVLHLQEDPELAVHPRCGTNLAVTAIVTGLAAFVAGSAWRGRSRLAALPQALLASLWGALLAQPLGLAVQRSVTTSPETEGVHVGEIIRRGNGKLITHFVPLSWD